MFSTCQLICYFTIVAIISASENHSDNNNFIRNNDKSVENTNNLNWIPPQSKTLRSIRLPAENPNNNVPFIDDGRRNSLKRSGVNFSDFSDDIGVDDEYGNTAGRKEQFVINSFQSDTGEQPTLFTSLVRCNGLLNFSGLIHVEERTANCSVKLLLETLDDVLNMNVIRLTDGFSLVKKNDYYSKRGR